MEKSIKTKNRKLIAKPAITVLSLAAAICAMIRCGALFHYDSFYLFDYSPYSVFTMAACLTFLIYVLFCFKKSKKGILLVVTYALMGSGWIAQSVRDITYSVRDITYITIRDWILALLVLILFALAIYEIFKGSSKKIFLILAPLIGMIIFIYFTVLVTCSVLEYSKEYISFGLISWPFMDLSAALLCAALALFAWKNRIAPIKMTAENALKLLQDDYTRGLLTEEEYQTQRAEIIRNI